MSNPEININQGGTSNTQNNTFNFAAPKSNQLIPSNMRQGSKNFVGREDELADIHAKLQEGQGVIVCAVEGMGGVGKTELALQYASRYQQEYVARYWLSLREMGLAQAVVTMASPYLDLPEAMQSAPLDEQAAWYWQNWLPESGKLLVILDDVPKAESIPDLAMPIDPRVRVLVTTRERELNVGFESVPLRVLSEEKALELLKKIVGAAKVDKELVTVKEICKTLGYLPLGIELIGEYLSKNRFLTFAKLQERLNLADESIARERKYRFYAHRGVEAAIQLSWDDISTGSQRVAMLLGLFAPVEILWELVAEIGASAEITEAELNEARGQLDSLHLIQPIDEECNFYKIHTLVREFFRAKLLKAEENHQFRQAFVNSLLAVAKEIPETPTLDLIARVAPAIPHLDILSREMLDDILNPDEDNNLAWVFTGIARFYEGQGFYALAEDPYQRCVTAVKEKLGDHYPDVSTSLNNLAGLYCKQGRYAEAEPLCRDALQLRQELLGDSHSDVANLLNSLAFLYYSQGRYEEAEPLYRDALQLTQELLGDRHLFVSILNNLGELYRMQGKYNDAESLHLRCLEIEKQTLGEDHPQFISTLGNLAGLYFLQGKYREAEPLYKQALSLRQELLGDHHPDVAMSLSCLAELYRMQGKYREAEPLFLRSLEIKKQLGEEDPIILGNLAKLYRLQEKYSDAEPLLLQALEVSKRQQQRTEKDLPCVATSLNDLAMLYEIQGKYSEAEPLLLKSLEIYEKQENPLYLAISLNNLAKLYYSQEKYDKAEPLYLRALEIHENQLGVDTPYFTGCLNNLAKLYYSQKRYSEAEPIYIKALAIIENLVGQDHPETQKVRDNLQLLRNQKTLAESP